MNMYQKREQRKNKPDQVDNKQNNINWFPGHMSVALREIKKQLKNVDVVLYVLDARAPLSSLNPSLSTLAENKPILYAINKMDLADEERTKEITKKLRDENSDICFLNSSVSGSSKIIIQKIKELANRKIEKYSKKGVNITIRSMAIGVPNSGKSTIVNNLCGKAKAITGDRPGVTKDVRWLSIGSGIEMCDTPGTLYPNLSNQTVAKRLAFVGSIKDEILDSNELAIELLAVLKERYLGLLTERYKEKDTLEEIAFVRGYVISKGEPDYERTSKAILDDFRKGRIGKITLD